VNEEAEEIIGDAIQKGYKQGQVFASVQLGAPYEVRRVAWKEIGARVMECQSDFKGITDETAKQIRGIIAEGIIQERSFGEITRDIVRTVDDVGITRAVVMARTETMYAVNDGVVNRYKTAGVEFLRWLACADEKTCEDCEELDGQEFPIDDLPPCPAHPACRCSWVPVITIPGEEEEE